MHLGCILIDLICSIYLSSETKQKHWCQNIIILLAISVYCNHNSKFGIWMELAINCVSWETVLFINCSCLIPGTYHRIIL